MKLEDVEVTVLDNGPGRICGKVKMKLVHRPSKYEVTGEGYSKTILKDKLLEELRQKVEIWEQLLAMYDSYKVNVKAKAKADMDSYYFAPAPVPPVAPVPVPSQTIKGSVGTIQDNATVAPVRNDYLGSRDSDGKIIGNRGAVTDNATMPNTKGHVLEFGKASGEPTTTEDLVAYYFAQVREVTKL